MTLVTRPPATRAPPHLGIPIRCCPARHRDGSLRPRSTMDDDMSLPLPSMPSSSSDVVVNVSDDASSGPVENWMRKGGGVWFDAQASLLLHESEFA
ncbi:hypothetical protein ZWY2020_056835 [Hordeum vulgare]|nr:hypothetical protein ZWY2020_056835 [Hordeum vulgare]